MTERLRLIVLAVIVCSAINSGLATGGAFGQFVVEMDGGTQAAQKESPDGGKTGGEGPRVLLRGGAVERASQLWIIQRSGASLLFDAELNRRGVSVPTAARQELGAQIKDSAPLQGEVNDTAWILPETKASGSGLLRGQLSRWVDLLPPGLNWRHPIFDPGSQRWPVPGVQTPSLPREKSDKISREIDTEIGRARNPAGMGWRESGWGAGPGLEGQFMMPADNHGQGAASAEIEGELRKKGTRATSEIDGQLKGASRWSSVVDVEAELRAQQASAKPMLDKQSGLAASALRAVFRRIEPPAADLETYGRRITRDAEGAVLWDAWYARVAEKAEPLLVRAIEGCGGPGGSNTVSVTVRRDHHVSVKLVHGGNASFDAAIVRAYRGLDGNPALAFPAGSRRTEVTFAADNNHVAPGGVSGVSTDSCRGDVEGR